METRTNWKPFGVLHSRRRLFQPKPLGFGLFWVNASPGFLWGSYGLQLSYGFLASKTLKEMQCDSCSPDAGWREGRNQESLLTAFSCLSATAKPHRALVDRFQKQWVQAGSSDPNRVVEMGGNESKNLEGQQTAPPHGQHPALDKVLLESFP